MADFPRYRWEPALARYRSLRTGRLVSPDKVRRALDVALQNSAAQARDLSAQLAAGTIDVDQWELGMRGVVKDTQLFSSAAARGGWGRMDARAFGLVGQRVRAQYGALTARAQQVRDGLPLDGRFLASTELYARQAKPAYLAVRQEVVGNAGFDEQRSILHPAEHCNPCVSEDAKGFQPMGQMIPIGSRPCGANDQCSVEFRNSQTGETLAA